VTLAAAETVRPQSFEELARQPEAANAVRGPARFTKYYRPGCDPPGRPADPSATSRLFDEPSRHAMTLRAQGPTGSAERARYPYVTDER
jgi:hypothetical protein